MLRVRFEFTALFLLTFTTGMADASSFLGLGSVFTANMTGNVVLLGFAVTSSKAAHAAGLSMTLMAAALAAFVAGALGGGVVAGRRGSRPRLYTGFGMELVALGTAVGAVAAGGASAEASRYVAVTFLGIAMGLQNALVRRMGVADVNTTVLTTTLGGLAADVVAVGGRSTHVRRRLATVGLLFTGAAAGAGLEQIGLVWSLAGALAVLTAAVVALAASRAPQVLR